MRYKPEKLSSNFMVDNEPEEGKNYGKYVKDQTKCFGRLYSRKNVKLFEIMGVVLKSTLF